MSCEPEDVSIVALAESLLHVHCSARSMASRCDGGSPVRSGSAQIRVQASCDTAAASMRLVGDAAAAPDSTIRRHSSHFVVANLDNAIAFASPSDKPLDIPQ